MGLPWFVAATVLAMTHVNSLKIESECSAPGEKPQFIGVREQRVTQIMIFVLCGLSVFFTNILSHIPMPVLYGVFLYMGTSSLKGSQFFERILIIFMPQKYQPDYVFLRHVPTYKVHLFTLIQVLCFAMLWLVKSWKKISISTYGEFSFRISSFKFNIFNNFFSFSTVGCNHLGSLASGFCFHTTGIEDFG